MKTIALFWMKSVLIISLLFAIGCVKEDYDDYFNSHGEPLFADDPCDYPAPTPAPTPTPDPVGTVTVNISKTTKITVPNVGTIGWTGPDNFSLWYYNPNTPYYVSVCNLGNMSGLGNITTIPQTGYSNPETANTSIACEQGHGYMIKFEKKGAATVYVRLYVVETIISTSGGVMGAKVKYQFPFEPTTLSVSKDKLSFTKDKNTQTLTVTTDAAFWAFSCDVSWINVVQKENTLSVSVSANNELTRSGIIIIQANEKRKEITVEQAMATTSAPYAVGDRYTENGVTGVVFKVEAGGTHGMIVSMDETSSVWSTAYEVTGCSDMSNGKNNMNTIKKISGWENKYPAFKWCNQLNTGTVSGWYLPVRDEINELFKNTEKINTTLMHLGKVQLNCSGENYYWSSTEVSSYSANYGPFTPYSGPQPGPVADTKNPDKFITHKVRAVRAF